MKVKFIKGLILVCCLLAHVFPTASGAAPHISDFRLGLELEELLLRQVDACEDRYCGQVIFGGLVWEGGFALQDGKVSSIALVGPYNVEYLEAGFLELGGSPYSLMSVVTDSRRFEFVPLQSDGKPDEETILAYKAFVQEGASGQCRFIAYNYGSPGVIWPEYAKTGQADGVESDQATLIDADQVNGDELSRLTGAESDQTARDENIQVSSSMADSNLVGSSLVVEPSGITVLIMPWLDMQAQIQARLARIVAGPVDPDAQNDQASPAETAAHF